MIEDARTGSEPAAASGRAEQSVAGARASSGRPVTEPRLLLRSEMVKPPGTNATDWVSRAVQEYWPSIPITQFGANW